MTFRAVAWAAEFTQPIPDELIGEPVDAAEVAAQIRKVLSDPKYPVDQRNWLERLLEPIDLWFRRLLAWVFDLAERFLSWLLSLFERSPLRWTAVVIFLIAVGVAATLLARRRSREIERQSTIERILALGLDPAELEALAAAAHSAGDFAEEIRLRFVAGLLRLDAAGMIDFAPGLANGSISQRLADPTFDQLSAQFDAVVYGKIPVDDSDAARATDWWNTLLGVKA